ncbi:ABC transporter permease [Ethanoligenens harbinense]|uniref:ABC-2 type transporter n=1 Tax=Ethanoligenens harbinense (strain DSM 18485 / JCM 12961 / CGMCC 1.5033 / YUAN-3) TaxID=663278 RepID=E6U7C5_ETHHY|nr:ABC transporter permease [Ethanoligenens harbinense]ADU25860.1 ABC-2 type transporter [Ethanoligenens harbinense YUAN-3]AVQ95020.1 ABC transporter permease [Ethanoligenens harbinense YUAN-3]AYF37713.1 ABC transporter permease [Ethanoligenens harbinense]AYF40432.1 ABC transporter permease [Ethanoligenens harbinense]QCN91267.1 ABC transporter permease [Ethanoligenens harbinense]
MNVVWSVTAATFKMMIRNTKNMIHMVLIPLLLIVVLSAVFSNFFANRTLSTATGTIAYYSSGQGDFVDRFVQAETQAASPARFVRVRSLSDIYGADGYMKYAAAVVYRNGQVYYYENENPAYSGVSDRIRPALLLFAARGGTETSSAANGNAAIQTVSLPARTSIDYYAVGILVMIIFNGAFSAMYSLKNDGRFNVVLRLRSAPSSLYLTLFGKIAGCLLISAVQSGLLLVLSAFMGADWGGNLPFLLFVLLTETVGATAFGFFVGAYTKQDTNVTAILTALVLVLSFLGGCFIPVRYFGGGMLTLCRLTPLYWTMQGLFQIIAGSGVNAAAVAVAFNLALGLLFLVSVYLKTGKMSISLE